MQSQRTLSKWSMLIVLAIFVTVGSLYLPPHTKSANAAAPFSTFTETTDSVPYTWTRLTASSVNPNTGIVDMGKWNVKQGKTNLGTIDSSVTITPLSNGYYHFVTKTTSTISGGIASLMSGAADQYPTLPGFTVAQESMAGDAASINGVGSKIAALTNGQAKQLNGTGPQGVAMVNNMRKFMQQQTDAYNTINNAFVKSTNFQTKLVLPASALILGAAGVVLSVTGGVIVAVCSRDFCKKSAKLLMVLGGIMAAIGGALSIYSGVSAVGWYMASTAAAGAASNNILSATEMGIRIAGESAAAAAAATAVSSDVESAFGSARSSFSA